MTTRWAKALAALPLWIGTAGAGVTPSVGNPASIFCVAHGGSSVVEAQANGTQRGYCVFPNGTRVDEWAYFRSMHRTHS